MNSVFIVTEDYPEYSILGVFATRELAEDFENNWNVGVTIDEVEIVDGKNNNK